MMLILGPPLLALYLVALVVIGAWIVRALIGAHDTSGLHLPTSLLLGLFVSFFFFLLTSPISAHAAIYASIAVPLIIATAMVVVERSIVRILLPAPSKSWFLTVGIAWLILLAQYGFECRTLLVSVAQGEGVIYQDIIYHGGIARSLALNGFPVQNLQYAGEYIGYHIFSHFVAAQASTLLSISPQATYTFVLTPFFFLLIVLSLQSFISVLLKRTDIHMGVCVVIIYASVLSAFLLSAAPDPSIPLYLSHSYQLQVASLGIVFAFLHKIYDGSVGVSARSIVLISLLFSQAILIKGSSLPLILAAFGAWIGIDALIRRRLNRKHIAFFVSLLVASGIVYLAFFHAAGFSSPPNDVDLYADRLYAMHVVREAVDLMGGHWIVVSMIGAVSILSYRLLLAYVPFTSYSGAVGTAFLTGVAMYLTMRYGANYYVLAIVCITNVYCLTMMVLHWSRMNRIIKSAVAACVLLSLYPVSNAGYPTASIMLSRKADSYYPLTHEKRRLYKELEEVSERESLIFTTSLAAGSPGVADNYYPASLSGRSFYVGGHRLKTQPFPGLEERLEFVSQFTLASPEDHFRLTELGVDFVLIETADLDSTRRDSTMEAVAATPLYHVVFQNEAGVLLKPR